MADKNFKVKTGLTLPSPLPVEQGGTGQTTTSNTLNAILPIQTDNSGKYLTTDGTVTSWVSAPVSYTRGMTSQRPVPPTAGDLFFNLQKKAFEVWTGSAWVSVAANGAVPDAPTLGTVTLSGLTASIPFTSPTDYGDAAITTYTITSSPGSLTGTGASSPISISGLSQSTTYTFTGVATNAYGNSLNSSTSNSITTFSLPGSPTSVLISDGGTDGFAYVEWTAPSSDGGASITDYVVEYSSNSGSSWTTFSDGTSTNAYATVTGLTLDTAYIFRVSAVNSVGTGTASSSSSSFTPVAHFTPDGVYEYIGSVVVGAGTQPTVTFSSIPNTYRHLQLRGIHRSTGSNAFNSWFICRVNGDSGTNYSTHYLSGNSSSASSVAGSNQTNFDWFYNPGSDAPSNVFGIHVIDLLDYSSTTKYKTFRLLNGVDLNQTTTRVGVQMASGLWRSTSPVSSITMTSNYGNFAQYSHFALYGIRG